VQLLEADKKLICVIHLKHFLFKLDNIFCYNICTYFPEGCLTVHLPHEINLNASLMKLGNFIDVFLAGYVSGAHAHHQEH
jgi:hypothetical protein